MMNEFTKEELGEIFWILEGCTMDFIGKEDDVLINKIQSMIDNCKEPCEHEFTRELMQIDLCDKCKSFKFVFAGVNDE